MYLGVGDQVSKQSTAPSPNLNEVFTRQPSMFKPSPDWDASGVSRAKMSHQRRERKVVYLIGAGASHASVSANGCPHGILMRDLNDSIVPEIRRLVEQSNSPFQSLRRLVNDLVGEEIDYEHLITFMDESPSLLHRQFARELRRSFCEALQSKFDKIENELADDRFSLYAGLLDMYNVKDFTEHLHGILTINYDDYIEAAAEAVCERPLNFGINLPDTQTSDDQLIVIKLHGSYSWRDTWPIRVASDFNGGEPLWIPPGIQKAKDRYPFNVLWGVARELLECDILRIIGCNVGPNDWDLISLLFTTRHSDVGTMSPYVVEVIDSPKHAWKLGKLCPYLDVRSILEIEEMEIGNQLVSELIGGRPRSFNSLTSFEIETICKAKGNWFRMWLKQMAEALWRDPKVTSVSTKTKRFRRILEE